MKGVLNTPKGQIVIEDDDIGRYVTKISRENLILREEVMRLKVINMKQTKLLTNQS